MIYAGLNTDSGCCLDASSKAPRYKGNGWWILRFLSIEGLLH